MFSFQRIMTTLVLAAFIAQPLMAERDKMRDFERNREAVKEMESFAKKYKLPAATKEAGELSSLSDKIESEKDASKKAEMTRDFNARAERLRASGMASALKGNNEASVQWQKMVADWTKSSPTSMSEAGKSGESSSLRAAIDSLLRVSGSTEALESLVKKAEGAKSKDAALTMAEGLKAESDEAAKSPSASSAQGQNERADRLQKLARLIDKTNARNLEAAVGSVASGGGRPDHGAEELAKTGAGRPETEGQQFGKNLAKSIGLTMKYGGEKSAEMLESFLSNKGEPFEKDVVMGMDRLQQIYDAVKLSDLTPGEKNALSKAKSQAEKDMLTHFFKARRVREILRGQRENPLTGKKEVILTEEEKNELCGPNAKGLTAQMAFCPASIACSLVNAINPLP